ncbi:MAG: DUF3791 domain-containing protein [Alistipes sp.]|jgi:hypothetical protein|nr:DUF3791 domain-containing protein [Alistipes sp.]
MKRLKEPRVLDRETENKVNFIAFIIQRFASSFKMSGPDAYLFLKKYGGLDYLYKYWDALHTDIPRYVVHEMFMVCRENGGPR